MAGVEALALCMSAAKACYEIVMQVKSNKARCKKIGKQVKSLEIILSEPSFKKAIQTLKDVPHCLEETKNAMVKCSKYLNKYGKKHQVWKIVTVYQIQEDFEDLQEDLHTATSLLHLFVSTQSYAVSQLTSSQSSPMIQVNLSSSSSQHASSAPNLPLKKSSPSAPTGDIGEAIAQRMAAVKLNKKTLLSNTESQQIKLADMKDELREGGCRSLLVIWVDPRPENNYRQVAKALENSNNVVFLTLASTGELVDALLSVRPLLNDKDDLRVRVVTNTWQPLFGAFEEDYEKDQEKNPNAWKEVVSVTDTFLKTSTPTFVFSIKRLADHVVKDFATQPVFLTPGKGLNYFNNQVDNGSLHRYLTFATVFVVWREVTDEFKEFYTYFAKQGVVLMMLDNNIIDQYFSQRPYLASAPIAVICNRFVAGNIRQLKNYAPKAGVFVYTGNQSVNDAKNAFSGVFNYQTNDGVYTNPDDLKRQCLVSLESQK